MRIHMMIWATWVVLALIAAQAALAYQPPELELPPYTRVAPGREIAFGLNAVDQDGDTLVVELLEHPPSAKYDPVTLTVSWKPSKADMPVGHFRVRLTEIPRQGERRAYLHDFSIAVDPAASDLPAPAPLGPVVEQVITIHDPERLAQANRDWPIARVFETIGRLEKKKEDAPVADLMQDALDAMAELHGNPRVSSMKEGWRIVAVRPRLDKGFQELRIVYENKVVPEPVFLMFRFRLAPDQAGLPPEAKQENNRLFTRLVYDHFFENGAPRPAHWTDKQAHSKAVSAFLSSVMAPSATTKALMFPETAGRSARYA
jgi:hypothetical protein